MPKAPDCSYLAVAARQVTCPCGVQFSTLSRNGIWCPACRRKREMGQKLRPLTPVPLQLARRATPALPTGFSRYCVDLDGWPRSWMGWEKDLPAGEKLVTCFRPFLEYLASSDLSPKTIQKHVDNLWVLGGEIIRDLNETPSLRKIPVERLLSDLIEDGGPLHYHGDSEEQQSSFESTCKKFRRFLTKPTR